MRVWVPGSSPGIHPPVLYLQNPNALLFFLEAVARGNYVFPHDKKIVLVAYQGAMQIGMGVYQVVGSSFPCLVVEEETGELVGVVREAWGNMLKRAQPFDETEKE